MSIQTPQVLLFNGTIDIYALGYISSIMDIEEYRTFQRDKLIDNEYSFEVKNFDNFFSVDNPISVFSGTSWRYSTIQVINEDGITIWDGITQDIVRDHNSKKARIITVSNLMKFIDTNISYVSSDWETPATAALNIMTTYGFTGYDSASIQKSIQVLTAASCYIKCNIEAKDNLTFRSALEKLSEYACADCFMMKGILYFKHYTAYTGGVSIYITEKDFISTPVVSSLLSEMINDYRIGYQNCGDVPATDANQGNIAAVSRTQYSTKTLPEMKSDVNAQIKFKDATSARYIGECYIRRTHKALSTIPAPLTQIDFNLQYYFKNNMDLQSYFRLTLSDEGWDEKLFETFKVGVNEENRSISILALEVDE